MNTPTDRHDTWLWTNRCPDCYDRSCGGRGCQDERPADMEPLVEFCGCETSRHFDGGPGHAYGQPNGPTVRLNVPFLAGDPFCEECRRDCWPDYADAVTEPERYHFDPLTRSWTR